jgi:hypothetical protein
MLFNKEKLVLTLQEKAHEKIEVLRHEMAQAMFDTLTEETFFVFDKKAEDVVGGPFKSKAKAQAFVKEMDSKDLVIMTEKSLEKKMGVSEGSENDLGIEKKKVQLVNGKAMGSENVLQLKDMDSVLNWFADHKYLTQEFDFDNETGVLTQFGLLELKAAVG